MEDRDYLAKLTNMFTPQQIPMSPTPSIVTADEDQTIYMAQQSQPAQMPQQSFPAGMFNPDPQMSVAPPAGVNLNAQNMGVPPQASQASLRPPPRPEVPPVPEAGDGAPVPPIGSPTATGVPELDAPGTIVPPETNMTLYEEGLNTLSQMSQDPTVQRGSGVGDVSETKTIMGETLYGRDNPERRGGSYRGEGTPMSNRERNMRARERFHANRQRNLGDAEAAALEEGTATKTVFGEILYANPNPDRRGGNNNLPTSGEGPTEPTAPDGRFNPDMPDDTVLPGQENMVPHADEESALAMETVIEAMPPAEAGVPAGVETPDGHINSVTQEGAKRVAAEDPVGFSKALNWFEKTFGITGQDLARFALFYVGSRLAGYKHGESMSWAFQASAGFLENRVNAANQLASGGKYTPESIEEFRRTGDASVLKLNSDPEASKVKVDFTKPTMLTVPVIGEDGKVKKDRRGNPVTRNVNGYEAADADGNRFFVDRNRGRIDGTPTETLKDAVDSQKERISSTAEEYGRIAKDFFIRGGREQAMNIDLDPTTEGKRMAEAMYVWADRVGIDPDSGAAMDVITAAARDAEKWAAQHQGKEGGFFGIGAKKGDSVDSLVPFINKQMLYKSGEPWAKELLKENENSLDPMELDDLNTLIIDDVLRRRPELRESLAATGPGSILADMYTYHYQKYMALSPKLRAQHEAEGGFGNYIATQLTTTVEQ